MKVLGALWAVCLVGLCHGGANLKAQNPPKDAEQEYLKPGEHAGNFLDKVDGSLFDALESVGDGLKVLRLLAKDGIAAKSLTFGSDTIWPGKNEATCLLATIYLDNRHPRLAVLTTRDKNNKHRKVYRYHDGEKWKGYKEKGHDARLKKLKEGCNSTTPQRVAPCKLDILNPDQTKVHVGDLPYKEEHELTLKKYSPDTGRHVRSIVDAGTIVWEADEYQKCIDVKSYTRGESILLAIKVEDLDELEHKYFEKLDGAWNEVDEDGFNDKVNIIMGGLMEYSGNEVHSETPLHPVGTSTDDHVDVPPQGSTLPPQEVTTPSTQHVEPTTEPKVSTSEKSNEVEDSGETPVEELQPEVVPPAESPEDDEPGKESESDDMGGSPVVESESKLVAVKESEPVTKEPNSTESLPSLGDSETSQEGNGGDTDEETQEPETPMEDEQDTEESDEEEDATADGQGNEPKYTKEELEEFKRHLIKLASKVDKNIFKVDGIKEDNLFALQLTPKDAKPVTHVTYGEKEIWSGGGLFSKSNLVEAIIYFYKDIPALVTIKALKGNNEFMVYKFSDSEGFWYDSEEKQFNKFLEDTKKQIEKIKAKEAEKAAQEESTSQDASSSDSQPSGEQEDVSQQISPEATKQESTEPAEPEQLLNPFLSKVDASLFHVEESLEDHVKVLKLTAKKGAEATKLVYNGKEIWSGSGFFNKSNLVEALIYFYKEVPALVTIEANKGGNRSVIYKFSDSEGFWRDSNEEGFNKFLEDTKKQVEKLKAREAETPKENELESSEPKDTPEVTTIQPEVQRNVGISSDNSIPTRHNATSNSKDGIKPPATTLANLNTFGRFGSMYNITSEISSKQDLLDVFGEALKFLKDKNPLSSEVDKNEAPPKVSTSSSLDKEESVRNTRLTPSKPLDPPGPLVLDLSVESADDDKVTLYKNDNGELKYRAFTSESGNYFEKILHYGVVIWEAEPGQRGTFASYHSKEDAMLVRMYVQTDGHVERKYFEKTAYGWASIEKEDYEKKLNEMKSVPAGQPEPKEVSPQILTISQSEPSEDVSTPVTSSPDHVDGTPITLDLASPNESEIGILGSDTNEVSTKTYSPKKDVKVTSVVDGGLPIWKASGKETFSSAKLSSRDGYSLLLIYLKDTGNSFGKHFEMVGGEWIPIDKKEYDQKLKDLKSGVISQSSLQGSTESSQSSPSSATSQAPLEQLPTPDS
ncbi:hypothetical protein BEWA_048010 [Theileria equi strain WA]|uniref:Signal peptide containing protein n=1 Tax=Theileria equi strain WA TaxID=1537102 RepID=L1LAQ9_THEEQ|nr:hypothetical protein BEWA_048010 [Theileria equi strain WA]EKX72334.1 hypothetical protein BEWA_048010 [Theileria equi strain WA]|eukprot:XP_004831786.1 hypothetical protein BEWA_048010 [Theileria equi strain WA]